MAISREIQSEMFKQRIEQEIAAIFETEIRNTVREFRSITRGWKKKKTRRA
jgi:hypothetical protein